jgi:hypothetical protein
VLGGVLGVVATTACDVDDLRPPEDGPTPSPPPSASSAPDSDAALVTSVAVAILSANDLVGVVRRRHPALEASAGSFARMHRRHLGVLQPTGDLKTRTATRVPSSAAVALKELRGAELGLRRQLARASVQADSGALARLLASMSAAVSQHLAVLPTVLPAQERR